MSYVSQAASPTESIWTTSSASTLDASFGRLDVLDRAGRPSLRGHSHARARSPASPTRTSPTRTRGRCDYLKLGFRTLADATSHPFSTRTRATAATIGALSLPSASGRPLKIEDPLTPPLLLRVASPSGSQNQAFDCDKSVQLPDGDRDRLRDHVRAQLRRLDEPEGRSSRSGRDILCDTYNVADLPPVAIVNDPTPDLRRGRRPATRSASSARAFKARFETPTCWTNNWPRDTGPPGHDPTDDAAIKTFFTDVSTSRTIRATSRSSSPTTDVPGSRATIRSRSKYFAGFYATGWDVVGQVKPCLDNDPHPWYGSTYRKSLDNGDVWGHFVNIVKFSSAGPCQRRALQLRRARQLHRRSRRVAVFSQHELGRDRAAEEAPAARQPKLLPSPVRAALHEAEVDQRDSASRSSARDTSETTTGSSSRSPSSRSSACVRLVVDRLDLAGRRLAERERGDVPRRARQVAAPLAADRRHGADPDPEVVAPEPVAEVVRARGGRDPRRGRSSPSRTSGSPRRVSVSTTCSK